MRNLKRALSLALASVMLLGMMVVGSSAASANSFTDADEISNKEAVAIATGLGIFDGYTDGSFGPKKVVTRAEMAVIITKILHGSDIDPAIFSGDSKFADVPAWAEGYVNLCDALNIVEGYNDTTFGTNDPVTTVQASTMLLKALGYYTSEGDALGTDWKLEATSKATALGFYGDLSLKMDEGLTRENVAELVFNALFAQRVAFDDVRGLHVKASDRNVVVTNGTEDAYNTLAQNTYGLYKVEGVVTENAYTNSDLFADNNTVAQTVVTFAEDTDVNMDGYTDGTEYTFKYATGLDMIGHAAKVYYTIEKKAPVVYAITDNAVKAEVVYTASNISSVASKAGFNRNTSETVIALNYSLVDTMTNATYKASYANGEPMLLISNSSDLTVDYAIVLDQKLDYVKKVYTNAADPENPVTTYTFETLNALNDETQVALVDEIAAEDYVIVTPVDNDNDNNIEVYIVEKAPTATEMLTVVDRTFTTTDKLSSATETFAKSKVDVAVDMIPSAINGQQTEDYAVTPYAQVALAGEYTLVFDTFGKLIGIADPEADNGVNVAYVAQFGHKINTDPSLNDAYRLTAHVYFQDGTDAVYYVDNTEGYFDDVKVDKDGALKKNGNPWNAATLVDVDQNNQTVSLNDVDANSFGTFIKLWDVEVDADSKTVVLNTLQLPGNANIVTNHKPNVTFLGNVAQNLNLYGNNDTVFFYVDGVYGNTNDPLTVGSVTGISNIPELTVNASVGTKNDEIADAAQLVYKDIKKTVIGQNGQSQEVTNYCSAIAVLMVGEELITSQSGVYFYNEKYTITRVAADEYTLTYHLYDAATGEYAPFTYEKLFSTYDKAKNEADDYGAGYYQINSKELTYVYAETGTTTGTTWTDSSNPADGIVDAGKVATYGDKQYVVSTNFVDYQDYGHIVTLYTGCNANEFGVDATKAQVIDLTTNNIVDLATLAAVIESNQKSHDDAQTGTTVVAKLSYTYKDNAVDYIYVMDVTKPATKDFQSSQVAAGKVTGATLTNNQLALSVALESTLAAGTYTVKYTVTAESLESGRAVSTNYTDSNVSVDAQGDATITLANGTAGRFYTVTGEVYDANNKLVGTFTTETVEAVQ